MLRAASKRSQFYITFGCTKMVLGRYHLRIAQQLGCKETEQQILDECGCSYGILMRLENFEKSSKLTHGPLN